MIFIIPEIYSLLLIAGIAVILIFGISLGISTIGYGKKK
jgi:hypothetical protein